MNRKSIILGFLLAFFLFSFAFPQGITPSPNLSEANETPISPIDSTPSIAKQSSPISPPEGPIYSGGQYQYEGMGTTLSTTEYAQGSNLSLQVSDFNYGEDEYGQIRLPAGWTGYQLDANVYNLYDQPYFIQGSRENGNFENVGTAWSAQYNIVPPDNTTNPYYGTSWGSGYGYSGNGARTWIEWWSGFNWDATQYVVWRNAINIQRDEPNYAKLTFRVRVNLLAGGSGGRGRLVIYAEVAGIVYRQLLDERCPNNGQWYNLNISIPYDDLLTWSVPGIINVRLGLSWTGAQASWDYEYWALDFDDVTLEVRGKVNPNHTWLDLMMNSTVAQTSDYGVGTYSIPGTWTNPTAFHEEVLAHWEATDNDARLVSFDYDLTLYITKDSTTEQQVGPDGSRFGAGNNTPTYWTTWVYTYQPYFFENYNLSITRPTTETWTLHEVTDALFNDRTSAVITTSTHFELSTSAINDVYGWWNFTLTSTNRVSSITTNFDTFRINPGSPSILTVEATLSVSSGQANLTLYDPTGYPVNESTQTVTSTTVNFPNIQFIDGNTYPAGDYTLCISYDDGDTFSITSAGFRSIIISVEHATSLTPDESDMWVSYADTGNFYPRVQFLDTDTNLPITGAAVNGAVAGNPISFYSSGGYYEAQIAKNLLDPGNYVLNIDANKTYFDSQSTSINLNIRGETSLTSPESPGLTIPYDEIFTMQVKYWDIYNDTGVNGATITTTGWVSTVVTPNGTEGWYNLTVNTTDKPAPGTYSLSIQADLNYYQNQTLVLTIVIREISTIITYTPPGSVPWEEDVIIDFTLNVSDPESSNHDGEGIGSATFTVTLDGTLLTETGNYTLTNHGSGSYTLQLLASSGRISTNKSYNLVIQANPDDDMFSDAQRTIPFTVRLLRSTITYDPPSPLPWGNDMVITFYYEVDDPASSNNHGSGITTINSPEVSCTLNGSGVTTFGWLHLGFGQYQITIYATDITQVTTFELFITLDDASDVFEGADRTLFSSIQSHQSQAIVDPPAQTVLGQNTPIIVQWVDLDVGGNIPGNLTNIVVSNCPVGGDQTFGTLSFTLDTSSWPVGTHVLTVTLNAANPPGWYEGDSTTVNVVIRIHYTGVTVQPPDPTPWGMDTEITVIWTDLDIGGNVPGGQLLQVVVSDCPVGGDQTFGSLTFTLNTAGWSISTGYTLNVTVYAITSPSRSYSDAWGSVTVVIRIHRAEVVVSTPAPTAWDFDTAMSVTWRDLDTGTTIGGANLDNITISNCPVGGDQTFGTLSFVLNTDVWTVGQYILNVTVYPDMSPQQYEIASYTVTVTIRAHYVSVTVDPPAQTPWGSDTDLDVTWRDVDTDTPISEPNLDNITVTGGPGGDQTFFTLTFTLDTDTWSVNTYSLTVWVYGTTDYVLNSGPVSITIRGHQTQTVVTPPQQTPFGFDTTISVSWLDLDQGSNPVPGGNLLQVVVSDCPVGGDQTFGSLSFTLDTDSWSVGTYILTVTTTASNNLYLGSSSTTTVVIRIHYSGATVQSPNPTPWGFDTELTVIWTDLDVGTSVPGGQLFQVVVSDCPVGGDQIFGSLSFTLDTSGWSISTGYTLNVTVYAITLPSRSYSDAWGSVTVVIRIHRVEVVVPTPSPTPWGQDTGITVIWRDLDTGTLVNSGDLDNVTISDCPIGGNQTFFTLSFTLDTDTWSVGQYSLSFTVFPDMAPQQYQVASYQVTVTIRTHYVSVTIDPPAQTPWGSDTDLDVTWRDVDTDTTISETNLVNVTVSGGPGGDQTFFTLSFTLDTDTWSVNTYSLTVWVYGNTNYESGNGPVTVTIRGHQTQTVVTPPQQTPFGFDSGVTVSWLDLDQGGSPVPGGNLQQVIVSNCPVGGNQTFFTLSFTLNTSTWSVGTYVLTVTTSASNNNYQGSSSSTTVVIRIHYTSISVQTPAPTPLELDTDLIITWTDLDTGASVPGAQLFQVVVSDCPLGGDQNFGILSFTLETSSWTLNAGYTLNVTVYASTSPTRSYSDAVGSVIVVIRKHRVNVIANPPSPVPIGGSFTLYIEWYDLDLDVSIPLGDLNNIGIEGNATYTNLPMNYTIDFNPEISTFGWSLQSHLLTVTLFPDNTDKYEIVFDTVLVILRKRNIVVDVDPIPNIPFANNTIIRIYVNDSDSDIRLDGQIYSIRIEVTGYPDMVYNNTNWIQSWNISTGIYEIPLLSGSWTLGLHDIRIVVTPFTEYKSAFTETRATVRPLATSFIRDPLNQVPWDEDANVTVYYYIEDPESYQDTDSLNGSTITIDDLAPSAYSVSFLGSGKYLVTISSNELGLPGDYPFTLRIYQAPEYRNGTLVVTFTVRKLITSLTYTQVPSTPYLDDFLIEVEYTVLDGESSLHDGDIINSSINILLEGLDGFILTGSDYTWAWDPGDEVYRIRIFQSAVPAIQTYRIRIDIISGELQFRNAQISSMTFTVRTVETELIRGTFNPAPYNTNVTIFLEYRVRDDFSQYDLHGINDSRTFFSVTGVGWDPTGFWTCYFDGDGHYRIVLNSSGTPYLDSWEIIISINRPEPILEFEEQTDTSTLVTVERATELDHTLPGNVGYIENVTVFLNYIDLTGGGVNITGMNVQITLINTTSGTPYPTPWYWILSYGGAGYDYEIRFNASAPGVVNVNLEFRLDVTWGDNSPFYANATSTFRAYILGQETELIPTPAETTPFGDNMYMLLRYQLLGGAGIDNSSSSVTLTIDCSQIPSFNPSMWDVIDLGNGDYNVTLYSSYFPTLGQYVFNVTMSWPTDLEPFYAPQSSTVAGRVRAISTFLDYQLPETLYWNENLNVIVIFTDEDHGSVRIDPDEWDVIGLTILSQVPVGDGSWNLTIDTSGLSLGQVDIELIARKFLHVNQTRFIPVTVYALPMNLTHILSEPDVSAPTSDPAVTVLFGEEIRVQVHLENLWGVPYDIATVEYRWSALGSGWYSLSSLGDGNWTFTIQTTDGHALSYQITIRANRTNHEITQITYQLQVAPTTTVLDVKISQYMNLTSFEGVRGTPIVVFANFTTFFGTGITNANVTWVVGVYNGSFVHWQNGLYNATIPTDGLAISTWTVYITASSEDVLQRVQPFTANLEEITTKIDVLGESVQVYWNESFIISIFYNDTWTGFPSPTYSGISDAEIRFTWAGGSGFLNSTGLVGWYEIDISDFTGVGTATYILAITGKKDGYQFASVDIQVRVLPRPTTVTIIDIESYRWIDGIQYNTSVNIEDPIWRVPVDDTVVVYVNFTDSEGNIITNSTQAQGNLDFLAYGDEFRYDPVLMLWIAELTIPIVGESSLSVSFSLAYHDIPLAGGTLDATLVPLIVVLENENVLVNPFEVNTLLSPRQYELELNISDSWHGIGLRGFTLDNITIDSLSIPGLQILWETWREGTDPGIYYLTVLCTSPGSGNLIIEIEANWLRDEQYLQEAYVNFIMNFQFSQTDTIAIFGGITIGVLVALILIGWSLWARVLSVPWEVRRMRKLIKTIEKDESYTLSKKDMKRFRDRGVTMEDKVGTAMATIGVVATPAMIPTIEEVEEITATEEDIMTELDKIPGLGPEEKTVLANEMRKIPRKDRIWFLDDLKRQMGQHRMDFLTQREEPPPTPEVAPVKAPPEPVPPEPPAVKPEVPPLEEVPAAEPPEPKALKEDRTAPTVLPPELQEVPAAPAAVVAEIHRELDKIPGLSDAEKAALVDHLKYLSKEERQATYNSLRQHADMDE